MDVGLREGDLYFGFPEGVVDLVVEFVFYQNEVFDAGYVGAEEEAEGAVAEGFENDVGGRFFDYFRVGMGDVEEGGAGFFRIGAVGDADGDLEAEDAVAECPVDELAGDEFFVGDNELAVVELADGGGADADLGDAAGDVADGDDVAEADGALEEDDEAGDEVGEDFLETEADAEGDGGGDPLDFPPGDVEQSEGDDDAGYDEDVAYGGGEGEAAAGLKVEAAEDGELEQSGYVVGSDEGEEDGDDGGDEVLQGDASVG